MTGDSQKAGHDWRSLERSRFAKVVSNCFALTGDFFQPEVEGIPESIVVNHSRKCAPDPGVEGMLKAYHRALRVCHFHGPSYLSAAPLQSYPRFWTLPFISHMLKPRKSLSWPPTWQGLRAEYRSSKLVSVSSRISWQVLQALRSAEVPQDHRGTARHEVRLLPLQRNEIAFPEVPMCCDRTLYGTPARYEREGERQLCWARSCLEIQKRSWSQCPTKDKKCSRSVKGKRRRLCRGTLRLSGGAWRRTRCCASSMTQVAVALHGALLSRAPASAASLRTTAQLSDASNSKGLRPEKNSCKMFRRSGASGMLHMVSKTAFFLARRLARALIERVWHSVAAPSPKHAKC